MIPLFKPYMPDLPDIEKILYSGRLAYGQYSELFEKELKEYFGTPYLLVTNSFFTAILVSVSALGLQKGDEIIASPMACLASTQPYLSMGLEIKWCDIDPARGTLDPDSLKHSISKHTKAVIHNHFCGYPGYIDEINKICKEYEIPIIDDGIECFGSEYKKRKIGACNSDVTVFSLGPVRIPNAIEGGVIIFKDKGLYEKSLLLRDCGINRSKFRDEMGEISPVCDIETIGYSAMMSNVNGYIGYRQIHHISNLLLQQRKNAEFLKEQFKFCKSLKPLNTVDTNPNYWVFGLLAKNKRSAIMSFRERGLWASGVHINNNRYTAFKDQRELQGVNDFNNHFVAIPSGWWIKEYDVSKRSFE